MSLILKHWLKVKLWKTYIIFGEWAFVFAGTGEHSNGIISYIDFCGKANKFRKLWSFYVSLYIQDENEIMVYVDTVLFVYGNKFKWRSIYDLKLRNWIRKFVLIPDQSQFWPDIFFHFNRGF